MNLTEMLCSAVIVASIMAGHITSLLCVLYATRNRTENSDSIKSLAFTRHRYQLLTILRTELQAEKDDTRRAYVASLFFLVAATQTICLLGIIFFIVYSAFLKH